MRRLQWLAANAMDVSLDCNSHRASYKTVAQELESHPDHFSDLDDGERSELVAKDSICELHIYPDTPGSSVVFIHWDPEVCVERGYQWLLRKRGLDSGLTITRVKP